MAWEYGIGVFMGFWIGFFAGRIWMRRKCKKLIGEARSDIIAKFNEDIARRRELFEKLEKARLS